MDAPKENDPRINGMTLSNLFTNLIMFNILLRRGLVSQDELTTDFENAQAAVSAMQGPSDPAAQAESVAVARSQLELLLKALRSDNPNGDT